MSSRIDHIALRTSDFESTIELLERTCGLRLLRMGSIEATGKRVAMVGDGTGMKLELIEASGEEQPTFAHVALRVDDVDAAHEVMSNDNSWRSEREPRELNAAKARTALINNDKGLKVQLISYEPSSADIEEWDITENTLGGSKDE